MISPQTTATRAELRQDLGAVAYERLLGAPDRGYIGPVVMPVFESAVASAKFPVIPLDIALKLVDDARSPGGNYNEINWRFTLTGFDTVDRGLTGRIDDSLLAIYRNMLDLEQTTTNQVADQILLNQERRVAALCEASADAGAAVAWNLPATADTKTDIDTARAAFRLRSGLLPNAVALSWTAFNLAINTKKMSDVLQYTSPVQMGGFEAQRQALANYWGVDQVLVAGGIKDSAQKGKVASLADIWSPTMVHLLRLSPGGTEIMEPCWGRTIMFTGDAPQILTTETYRDEEKRSDIVRVRNHLVEFVQYAYAKWTLNGLLG